VNNQEIPTHVLIDCRAMGIAFMHQDFAHHHQLPLQQLMEKTLVEVTDGRPIEPGDIRHIGKVGLKIQEHWEQLAMCVTKLGHYSHVLVICCLQLHDVPVWFASTNITFGSQYYATH
jgi:hypothetical protein